MHMIKDMPKHSDHQELPPYLRRRVVFELTLEELPLLEQAEREHGTKRLALVRALERLSGSGELEQRLRAAEAEAARLGRKLEEEQQQKQAGEKGRAKLARELEKAKKSASETSKGASAAERRSARELEELEAALEERELEIAALDVELAELREQVFEELFCARCGEWVSLGGLAWKKAKDGPYAYHRGCGDHGPGLVTPSSWLGWRRD